MPSSLAVRVQEKGQVTIPREIRDQLRLKKGDFVTFVITEQGVLVQPVEVVINLALDRIGEELKERGVTLDELMAGGRKIRGRLLKEMYGIDVGNSE